MVAAIGPADDKVNNMDAWLHEQQTNDAECTKIMRAICEESDAEPGERMSECFLQDENGLLCKVGSKYNLPTLLPVVPSACVAAILRREHDEAGHPGRNRTLSRVKSTCFWVNMDADVREFVKTCERCQKAKTTTTTRNSTPLGTLTSTRPGELVACDLLSGLRVPVGGEVAVLVIVDHFSKWAQAVALKDKSSATVAQAFEQTWIAKHGAPTSLLTDQGPEFTGAAFMALCKKHNIKKTFTTTYHPQGDGQVERMNRTLLGRLTATVAA
jgi:transposase InsO family protein